VLFNLADATGQLRMRDLAAGVLLSRSGLSRLVDRMAAKGLVRREQDPDDRRGTLACITDDGMATLRAAAPVHLRGIEQHFASRLHADEVEVMQAALTRIASGPPTRQDPR
jgi:DNA-binding MarR family transcriptional regulator